MMYNLLQPLAFRYAGFKGTIYTMRVPEAALRAAVEIATAATGKPYLYERSLREFLNTTLHGAYTPSGAWGARHRTLLLSAIPYPPQLVSLIITTWLSFTYAPKLGYVRVQEMMAPIVTAPFRWEEAPLSPDDRGQIPYSLVPDVAARLLEEQVACIAGTNLRLFRLAQPQGAALLTRPFAYANGEGKKYGYAALLLQLHARMVPGSAEPMLYAHLSLRRFKHSPRKYIPSRARFMVGARFDFMGDTSPYRIFSLPVTYSGEAVSWGSSLADLLCQTAPGPESARILRRALATDPVESRQFLGNLLAAEPLRHDPEGLSWALMHNNALGTHPVSPGVSLYDSEGIFRHLRDRLAPAFLPATGMLRAGRLPAPWPAEHAEDVAVLTLEAMSDESTPAFGVSRPSVAEPQEHVRLPKRSRFAKTSLVVPAYLNSLASSASTIYVLHRFPSTLTALQSELIERFALTVGESPYRYHLPDGQALSIVPVEIPDQLYQPLELRSRSKAARAEALDERARAISMLPGLRGHSGQSAALVEIPSKSEVDDLTDPKPAFRIGLGKLGIPNQHIHTVPDTGSPIEMTRSVTRVRSAVSDMLRQLAILPAPLVPPGRNEALPDWLVAFGALRRQKKTSLSNKPVIASIIVRSAPHSGLTEAITPDRMKENRGWAPYPVVICELLENGYEYEENGFSLEVRRQLQQEATTFVIKALQQCLHSTAPGRGPEPSVLFMAETLNARTYLPFLADKELTSGLNDTLTRWGLSLKEQARLTIARLRVSDNRFEVPAWVVADSDGARPYGIFRWEPMKDLPPLFISIGQKATSDVGFLKGKVSRIHDGNRNAWNPRPVEISVLHCPGSDPAAVARLLHQLRRRWPFVNRDITLPIPLSFALRAIEYAIGVDLPKVREEAPVEDSADDEEASVE